MINMIEIDNIDKRILFELEKNARIPDVKLARIVGKSKDTVRYRIKKLEQEGIIQGWKTWIDLSKLGYRTATLYFNLVNLPEKRRRLIEEIKKDPKSYWIGVAEGAWNIGVTYFIKSNKELFDIKNNLLSRYHDLIVDVRITSLVSVSVHEKTFLVKGESSLLTFTENVEELEIDNISKKLLQALYFNSRANIATLADKLKTTIDIIRNRMRKLEGQKIIIRYTIAIDYQKIGYEFYKAFVYLKEFDEKSIDLMLTYSENSDRIINIVKQLAPWDIEFIIFAKGFSDYNAVMGDFTEKFRNFIGKVETAVMSEDIIFPCPKLPFD